MIKRFLGKTKRYVLNRYNNPAVVLLYHRVTTLENDPQLLSVTPDHFYEQVNLLRQGYTLLQIDEFVDILANRKKFPPKACILTFDDGYADNLHEALPILETLQSQALFYITTSNLNTTAELWWDELERIVLGNHPLPQVIEIKVQDKLTRLPTSTTEERLKTYHLLHPLIKYLLPQHRNREIDSLRQMAGLSVQGRESHRLLTTDELLTLGKSPAAVIGAHTHNHPALSALPYQQQLEEMERSKKILQNILNKNIHHFSYPYGSKKDYNENSVRACLEAGFKMVCSNQFNQVHSWTDIYQVPRILVRNWNRQTFGKFISKCFTC